MTTLNKEQIIDGFCYSTDKQKLDVPYIQRFLSAESYWAAGIPLEVVKHSIDNSLCVGIYEGTKQVGFARLITDYATFGYLGDVFVDPSYRGKGLSKRLMEFIMGFEEVKAFRRFLLVTQDAQDLYARYGFKPISKPERYMEIHQPNKYKNDKP